MRLDRSTEGLRDIENSLALYQSLGDESNIASLHQELGLAQSAIGELEAARVSYLKALEYWRMLSDPYRLADLLNCLGVLNHQLGDYECAFMGFDEGLKNARRTGYLYREAFILASLGDLLFDLGADQNAWDVFEEAQHIAQRTKQRYLCFYMDYALACLARQAGDLDGSRRLSKNAAGLALPDSNPEQGLLALESARQCLAEDHAPQAISFLNTALEHFRTGRLASQEILAYLLLAAAFLTLGDEETSKLQIKIALEKDLAARPLTILCSDSRAIIPALECAVKDAQIGVQAGRILERLCRLNERIPEIRRSLRRYASAIELRQPRIAIQAFGAMRITVDGRKISGQDWKSQQQRDLLFYLLQHNTGASKERLDRDIWGGVEENSGRLRNALYKI